MIIWAGLLYLASLIFLSWLGFKRTSSTTDYLLGGRNTNSLIMALSYGATFISTSAIIGFGSVAANNGMGILGLAFLNVFIGVFIAFVFFGKRTHRLGVELDAHTFPELIGKRFNSKSLQTAAGMMIFLFMPIYAAAIIKGGVNFMEAYFHIPYDVSLIIFVFIVAIYVMVGGFKAVMYTDAFQGAILFFAMLVLTVFTYVKLGGVIAAHEQLTALFTEPSIQNDIAGAKEIGFLGWTSMPKAGSPMWWSLVSSLLGAVGFGVLAQPQLIVRFMTVKRVRDLNRAVFSGGLFIMVMVGGAYVVGALSNVIIFNDTGNIARVAASGVSDGIIPYFIVNYMPEWFAVIFLLSMLSASMSTLSAQFHTMGSALGRDVGRILFPQKAHGIAINRYGMAVTILISLVLAWLAKYLDAGDAIIAKGTIIFFEMTLCAFMPVYLGTLFCKRMPRKAAEVGAITGFTVWFVWTFFISVTTAPSLALCKLITGKSTVVQGTVIEKFSVISASIVGMSIAILAIALVWIFSSKKG